MPTHATLRFRQVHLDFHTSPAIPGVGARFDKAQFQVVLKRGHVDSITIFSKCHHGSSYHPTAVGRMHPSLSFDLLDAQVAACRELDVNHPNALRYECAAMLAFGSKCSVGDQLHPDGEMDATTYGIIGEAYAEVERKRKQGARPAICQARDLP